MTRSCLRVMVGLSFAAGLVASSCGPEQVVHVRVADLLPVLDVQVGTEVILPSAESFVPELGKGWAARFSSRSERRTAMRVRALRADIHVIAAAPGDLELAFEAQALNHPDDGPQTMTILLQGVALDTFELSGEYQQFSQVLPAESLKPGRNLVTLEFASVGPIDSEEATVMGAARVRKLEVRRASGRPAWQDLRAAEGTENEAETAADPDLIEHELAAEPELRMPTDSVLDFVLEVPEGGRVAAELIRELADQPETGAAGGQDITASIELIDSGGQNEVLYEHRFGGSSLFGTPDRDSLDLPLTDWAGEHVLLRLRVRGGVNGHVVWTNLRITCACEGNPPAYLACDPSWLPASGRLGRPDIFIILLDAARADAFSTFGASRPTPHVDSLAAEGTKFTRAYSPSSWTAPTTASLLTGRYPDAHGVEDWDQRLPASIPTVTEMLAAAGYYTFLGSHHLVYHGNRPLRRGFEGIELIDQDLRSTLPGPESLFDPDRPTFALIHLLPPHSPYEPPPPYRGLYAGEPPANFEVLDPALNSFTSLRLQPSEDLIRYVRDRYDENVAYADELVGRIVEMLRQKGRYDNALVILLADHGEGFFEHEAFLHRKTVHEEVLRIPLVFKWPASLAGYRQVVEQPVSLVDLGPTLVDGLGLESAGAQFQGISLLPEIFDGAVADRVVYASTRPSNQSRRRATALYRGQQKIIIDEDRQFHLYDLSLDPLEQIDEASDRPVAAQLLLQELRAQQRCNLMLLAGAGGVPQIELDAERLRQLRALGYIQ